ncbi:MAG: ABC transporter ATP-binding protein [Planctomycetota bacterium]|nr:ABC transporter ATP-binding protein [Planctomycetota bacterium]
MIDSPAIDVADLKKEYRDGWIARKRFRALKGINLQVNRGEVFGLLGPNGAGKTTLIKILLGIVRSTGGKARMLGDAAGSKKARRKIGYLPENLNFPAHHTATRALNLYGRLSYVADAQIKTKSAELLELVGLAGREKEYVRKYSKGMRQRLGLAQALLHDPELLIMDEPTDGLDPLGRSQIRQLISYLRERGKTVFLNSHILQEVELVCDRVAILAKGKLIGVGTPAELTAQFFQNQNTRVRIELSGTPEQFSQLQKKSAVELIDLPEENLQQLTSGTDGQDDVDKLVDCIRGLDMSIHKLERSSLTLEEVFLSAVQAEDE